MTAICKFHAVLIRPRLFLQVRFVVVVDVVVVVVDRSCVVVVGS